MKLPYNEGGSGPARYHMLLYACGLCGSQYSLQYTPQCALKNVKPQNYFKTKKISMHKLLVHAQLIPCKLQAVE